MPSTPMMDAACQHTMDKHGSKMSQVGPIHKPNVPAQKEAPVRPHPVKGGPTKGS